MPAPAELPGPIFGEPIFQGGKFIPDPAGFQVPHPSDDATYTQLGRLLETQTVPVPASRAGPGDIYSLATVFGASGPAIVEQVTQAGQIAFHCVGDSGASSAARFSAELKLADRMVTDFDNPIPAQRPVFFFHLGDLVYSFGESKYYYDEFYEPFRNYPRPILAIPGNHDAFIVPGTLAAQRPLTTFHRNFCATHPVVTKEAFSLHRTAMTQPGVYFALDAPFVRVIGLFSNALEDPGLISSEKGRWPAVADVQLDFLRAQLQRVRTENYRGAVLLAMHHPPFSYTKPGIGARPAQHGGSPDMLRDIDTICAEVGVYPHAFLSGHAHNYQRFTRKLTFGGASVEVPFVICGNGGHNVTPIERLAADRPQFGTDVSYIERDPAVTSTGLVLEKYDDQNFGYLIVSADPTHLRIGYYNTASVTPQQTRFDLVTVDLATRLRVAN